MIGNIYCVLLFFAIASPAVPSNKINSCSLNEFMCGDGSCVVFERVCDGAPDCVDLSDERRCGEGEIGVPDQSPVLNRIRRQTKCRKFEWGCRDGSCIAFDGKCDGKTDCPDGSDETHAVCRKMRCQSNWFRCTYGACVDGTAPCNNVQECADNSDELLPRCRNETEDIRSTFRCDNGQLIAAESHCDGTAQCTDGSDETVRACAAKTCPAYLFQCAYGACVDSGADCNGVRDCADGSDEADDLCGRQAGGVAPATGAPPAPGSVPDKCVVPPFPAHGTFLSDGVLTPGDVRDNFVLNISCEVGYAVSNGVNVPIWCINGKWLGETQDCVRACRLIQNPSVSYKCRLIDDFTAPFQPCPPYVPQTMFVQPECRPGYFTSGSLAYMRCSDGNFEYSPYCTEECGSVVSQGDVLAVGGRPARRGEFPWHVAVYDKRYKPVKQICGGSLVSRALVISAAHCFYNDSTTKLEPASTFMVAAGKIYKGINSTADSDSVQKTEIAKIFITQRYRGIHTNFQEDIALLTVATRFEYTLYVQPVCLDFKTSFEHSQLDLGEVGKVAGWGYTSAEDNRGSSELRVVDLPYVDIKTCQNIADPSFLPFLTSDKICAGKTDGTVALCKGDSGGGLTFSYKMYKLEKARYYLRGITSAAPRANDLSSCNIYTIIAFTSISYHENFINEVRRKYA